MKRPALSELARWLLPLALAIATVLGACSTPNAPRFPHEQHLTMKGCGKGSESECLKCTACHSPTEEKTVHDFPDAALCDRCHTKDRAAAHRVLSSAATRVKSDVTFDHARHLAMPELKGQCVPCHAGVVKGGRGIPAMDTCFGCHEHAAEWGRGECAPCHEKKDLAKTMPQTFLRHEGNFARHHGDLAARDQKLCQSCHEQSDCDDCHDVSQNMTIERRQPERVERSFVHRGDFVSRHATEAASEPSRCVRCHEPATCDACHIERGVSGALVNARNPHPPGWVGNDASGRSLHGKEARRNILLCASCHDQGPETNCVRCHSVGGYGGNPHPSGYRSLQGKDDGMCRYCHE